MDNKIHPLLAKYLDSLNKILKNATTDERSELKSHFIDQVAQLKESNPDLKNTELLRRLGPVKSYAHEYFKDDKKIKIASEPDLLARYRKFIPLLFIIPLICFFVVLYSIYTPLFEVDEDSQKVTLLGGLIQIDGTTNSFKFKDNYFYGDTKFEHPFDGEESMATNKLHLKFSQGKHKIHTHQESTIKWNCTLSTEPTSSFVQSENAVLTLNFKELKGSQCDVYLPRETELKVSAHSGQLELHQLESDSIADLQNGQVIISPSATQSYLYDLKVKNGSSDNFDSLDTDQSVKIKVYVENGQIKKLDQI